MCYFYFNFKTNLMLKKVFIWGIALFGMTAISSNVSASAASDVYSVATVAESLEGNYQGNLIRVYMNGEKIRFMERLPM